MRTPQERAARQLRWYPKAWRNRYGEEFTELLIADLEERPQSAERAAGPATGARLMAGVVSPVPARAPAVMRAQLKQLAPLGVVVLLCALLFGTFWYRTAYSVWPGQGAGSRVEWCGRHYDSDDGGPAISLRKIQATYDASYRVVGDYPPLGLAGSQVVALGCDPTVPTVIFLSVGPDRYVSYGLSGAP